MRPGDWKLKTGLAILVVCLVFLTFPWIQWRAAPSRLIDIAIIDKTVPDSTYREHKGLAWLLNQQKIVDPNRAVYDYRNAYYGYHPDKEGEEQIRRLPTTLRGKDLIYLADSYGVYEREQVQEEGVRQNEQLVYGGMNLTDINKIQAATSTGTTLIAEYNIFAEPTSRAVSGQLQKMLGVDWKGGWTGKYFNDLAYDVPLHIMENYTEQTGMEWSYKGKGLILIHNEGEMIVLDQRDLGKSGVDVSFSPESREKYGVKGSSSYTEWFEIVDARSNAEIVAYYKLSLSESGSARLKAAGIPNQFPAVVRYDHITHQSYYFAGDFAKRTVYPMIVQYKGWEQFVSLLISSSSQDAFYWNTYIPLMKHILSDIENKKM
ncbi:hypothetical protein M3231_17240 [Neobacillus mesonae]|nr:hypothetical protein [Neobacillus mesonae]